MGNKKEFALAQIAPYFKNPSTCGYDGRNCLYLTSDGKMCVAGKNLLPHVRETIRPYKAISHILYDKSQSDILIPSSCDILTSDEWQWLQYVHDAIAKDHDNCSNATCFDSHAEDKIFEYQELVDYCKAN